MITNSVPTATLRAKYTCEKSSKDTYTAVKTQNTT